ncbi:MAG TPA: hypothetical protein VL084_00695 [Thermoanaerobaculia bacterium]|nr:hypothetical protein [Thermoanaerobaculia bacterium]
MDLPARSRNGDRLRRRGGPAVVFLVVLAFRIAAYRALEASPLSAWPLWTETDEWGYMDWSARLAAGNWLDVPAWRSYFSWQEPYGSPEAWETLYRKNAYFAGPLYPYTLALIRMAGLPLVPSVRLLQLLLAGIAAAAIAAAVQAASLRFLRRGREGDAKRNVEAFSVSPLLAGLVAGLLYGLYGPLVFHDGFAYRDGPVAHVSALLLALPLLEGAREREDRKGSSKGMSKGFFLGLLGGLAALLKQTLLPLALFSVLLFSKKSPVGAKRRFALGALGLAIPLLALAARNLAAGVPPLTFDTRQAIGLAWGNARGADGTTAPPEAMKSILENAGGSTSRTAWFVLKGYADAPWELPILWAKKALTFFLSYEVPDNSNWYFFRDRLPVLRVLPVFPCLVGAGLVGLVAALARGVLRKEEGWLMAVAIATPLAACLLVQTTSRYRVGVVPPLALGFGLFVLLSFEDWRARRRARVVLRGAAALFVGGLSAFLPSPIPTPRHRWADTIVAATLAEAREGPRAGEQEIRRYLEEGRDDPQREEGKKGTDVWLTGRRDFTRVAPGGIAPPNRRYGATADGTGR